MCGFGGTRVNGGHDGMPREGCFDRRVCFGITDLSDDHEVGVKSESRNDQVFLTDVVSFVLARAGQRVNHIVLHLAEAVSLDEEQLTSA